MHLVAQSIYMLLGGEPPDALRRPSAGDCTDDGHHDEDMSRMVSMLPQTPFQMPCRRMDAPET